MSYQRRGSRKCRARLDEDCYYGAKAWVMYDGTLRPIPIGCRTSVTTLFNEGVFKVLKIISVPREEHSREMDLLIGLGLVKTQMTPHVP